MVKKQKMKCKPNINNACNGGGIYCIGFIGAAVYYISIATSFWGGVLGVGKALFWPAFLVFELLKFLAM
jgi:hypothetical protein